MSDFKSLCEKHLFHRLDNLCSEKITLTNRQPSHPISIVKLKVLRKLEFVGDITINGI